MSEVEFVDRKKAEAEAKRAITLLNKSDESKVEAWFALQAVADQIGPASNVGCFGISWSAPYPSRPKPRYLLKARCRDGLLSTSTGAPPSLEEARQPEHLNKAKATFDRAVERMGGLDEDVTGSRRPKHTGAALLAVVSRSTEGRTWLHGKSERTASARLCLMVRVADAYGRDGVFPEACVQAHENFIAFPNRAELIRKYPTREAGLLMARRLRSGEDIVPRAQVKGTLVPPSVAYRIALRSGVSTRTARAIYREAIGGSSKTKLIRAVNEAIRMVDEMPDSTRLRAAA